MQSNCVVLITGHQSCKVELRGKTRRTRFRPVFNNNRQNKTEGKRATKLKETEEQLLKCDYKDPWKYDIGYLHQAVCREKPVTLGDCDTLLLTFI